jgi:cytoskeleton protein RodZ
MLLSTAHSHGQVDPAEALMREVGEQLRQVRLERGEDLERVAQHLRIKPAYLHALERGDMAALPGRTYTLGFLRTYADYLRFNGNDLVARIRNVVGTLTDRSRLHIRTPLPESRMPKAPVIVLSLALVAGVYGVWIYLHSGESAIVEPVSEVPQELRQAAPDPLPLSDLESSSGDVVPPNAASAGEVRPAASMSAGDAARVEAPAPETHDLTGAPETQEPVGGAQTPAAASAPAPAIPSGTETAASAEARDPAEAPGAGIEGNEPPHAIDGADAEPEQVAAAAEPVAPEEDADADEPGAPPTVADVLAALDPRFVGAAAGAPRVYEAGNADARVILRARSTSWIEVTSANGDYRLAATLLPGEVFLVPDRPDLTLWTGNAGGLEVIVDGQRLRPLGDEGAVMRRVPLDRAALLARGEAAGPMGQ